MPPLDQPRKMPQTKSVNEAGSPPHVQPIPTTQLPPRVQPMTAAFPLSQQTVQLASPPDAAQIPFAQQVDPMIRIGSSGQPHDPADRHARGQLLRAAPRLCGQGQLLQTAPRLCGQTRPTMIAMQSETVATAALPLSQGEGATEHADDLASTATDTPNPVLAPTPQGQLGSRLHMPADAVGGAAMSVAGERNFACPDPNCHKTFMQVGHLERHLSIHSQEFQCTDCQKRFSRESHLVRHRRIHTGEFQCTWCHRRFAGAHTLERHQSVHPEANVTHPFLCTICEQVRAVCLHF